MKNTKSFFKIFLALTFALSMSTTSFANTIDTPVADDAVYYNDGTPVPYWDNISSIIPAISSSGTTIYPEVIIHAKDSSSRVKCTMYLEKKVLFGWTEEESWYVSQGGGYLSMSKKYEGEKGEKYRVRVEVVIDGEEAEATSETITL